MNYRYLSVLLIFIGALFSEPALSQQDFKQSVADLSIENRRENLLTNVGSSSIRILLAPALETTLVSPISARIETLNAGLGESVLKNEILVILDCSVQEARLQISEAELTSARQLYNAKIRLQALQQAGNLEVAMAASAVARAKAQVSLHISEVRQCTIKAPFSGHIAKVMVNPYQGVASAQPLLEIVSDGALKLRLNVPARWIVWLKEGHKFDIKIDETEKEYSAEVSALNARIDAVSRTIELEATITTAAPELLPGMSGVAFFTPPN